jgi:hypothetical protein
MSAPITAPAITIPMIAHNNVLVPCVGALDVLKPLPSPQATMISTIPGAEVKQFMTVLLA